MNNLGKYPVISESNNEYEVEFKRLPVGTCIKDDGILLYKYKTVNTIFKRKKQKRILLKAISIPVLKSLYRDKCGVKMSHVNECLENNKYVCLAEMIVELYEKTTLAQQIQDAKYIKEFKEWDGRCNLINKSLNNT